MQKVSKEIVTSNGSKIVLEASGETVKDVFDNMAALEAVFAQKCWLEVDKKWVSHDNFKCVHRQLEKGMTFRELVCVTDADSKAFKGYKLQLNDDDGKLYPRAKNYKTNETIGTNGWSKFENGEE